MTAPSELASTLSGAVLMPLMAGGLLYSGAALVRRPLAEAALAVRLVGTGLATMWLLVVVSLVLLFCQCFHAVAFAGVSLAVACACWRWIGKVPVAAGRLRLSGGAALLVALGGALLLVQVARALVLPPLAWDSLTYHLTIPAFWIQHGGYCQWAAPDAFGDYSRFPANGELFGACLMLPFHGDLLVNLFGLPFLLLGGAAVHGLASELGASRRTAGIAATVWMSAPPAFAYVTTQYVDLPMAAEVLAGWLFAVRFVRTRSMVDGALCGAAFGLAAGTKHLGLVPAAVVMLFAMWLLVRHRGRVVRGLALGALAGVAVSVPWYVRNWIETGNPVYPFPVAFGGRLLFAGSAFQANVPVLPGKDISFWTKLITFEPGFAPITLGPPAVLVAALGLLGIVRGLAGPRRADFVVLTAAIAADLLVFSSEGMRTLREHWSDITQRFLLGPFGLLLVGMATLGGTRHPRVQRFVLAMGAGAVGLYLAAANLATLARDEAVAWIALWLGALAAAAFVWRPRRGWLVVAGVVGWLVSVPLLADFRGATRADTYAHGFDLHASARNEAVAWVAVALLGQEVSSAAASRGWSAVDDPDRPLRIAYVAGWASWGHNWMVYPLLGRRLQNEVIYVPSTQSGAPGTYQADVPHEAMTTPHEWLERLRRSGAQVLYVAMPAPPELAWAEARPDVFSLRVSGAGFRLFDVR